MKDENQSTESSIIIKGVRPKTIILIVLAVLALFVVYEYISSKIQESKEKVIIQEQEEKEKALLKEKKKAGEEEKQEATKKQQEADRKQQEITRQLNNCLDEANRKKNEAIASFGKSAQETCRNSGSCVEYALKVIEGFKAEERLDRDDCYKRYK